MHSHPEFNRLRWQCRRGMLELDVLLLEFLEQHYLRLNETMQNDFVVMLKYPDQSLQRWLIGDGADVDVPMQGIVKYIRQHAGPDGERPT